MLRHWVKSFAFGGGLPITLLILVFSSHLILRKRRLGNALCLISLLLISLMVVPKVTGWIAQPLLNKGTRLETARCMMNPLCQAPAIVVPSSGINKEGWLTESTWWRVRKGVQLWKANKAPLLVFTGGHPNGDYKLSEAQTMAEAAKNLGVPESRILTENGGNDTHENAIGTHLLLQSRGVKKILLVTSRIHLPRADATFRKAGFETIPVAADPLPDKQMQENIAPPSWLNAYGFEAVLNEYLGYTVYALLGWL